MRQKAGRVRQRQTWDRDDNKETKQPTSTRLSSRHKQRHIQSVYHCCNVTAICKHVQTLTPTHSWNLFWAQRSRPFPVQEAAIRSPVPVGWTLPRLLLDHTHTHTLNGTAATDKKAQLCQIKIQTQSHAQVLMTSISGSMLISAPLQFSPSAFVVPVRSLHFSHVQFWCLPRWPREQWWQRVVSFIPTNQDCIKMTDF